MKLQNNISHEHCYELNACNTELAIDKTEYSAENIPKQSVEEAAGILLSAYSIRQEKRDKGTAKQKAPKLQDLESFHSVNISKNEKKMVCHEKNTMGVAELLPIVIMEFYEQKY